MKSKTGALRKLNKPASASIWYTAGAILERGSAVIFTPVYTRLLLPAEYGVYSLFIGVGAIVTVIATLEISGGAVYRGLKEFGYDSAFIPSALGLISVSSLASILIYLIFMQRINTLTSLNTEITLLLFLQVFFNGVRALKISEQRFLYSKKFPIAEGLFFSLITPTLSLIFIAFFKLTEYGRIYASLISSALFAVPIIFSVIKKKSGRLFDKRVWRFLLKYSLPALPHFLSMSLIWQIGKICVSSSFSTSEAGLFSLAMSIGLLPTILSTGAHSALIPWITRKLADGRDGRRKIYSFISSVFLPFSMLIILFVLICPELFTILASSYYKKSLNAVYPIAATVPLIFLSGILASEISYYKKTFLVTLGSGIGALFNLFFNLLFTFRYGFFFSSLLFLPTFIIINLVYISILRFVFKDKELPIGNLASAFCLFVFFCISAFFLQFSLLSRALILIACIMLIFPKAKGIYELIREH